MFRLFLESGHQLNSKTFRKRSMLHHLPCPITMWSSDPFLDGGRRSVDLAIITMIDLPQRAKETLIPHYHSRQHILIWSFATSAWHVLAGLHIEFIEFGKFFCRCIFAEASLMLRACSKSPYRYPACDTSLSWRDRGDASRACERASAVSHSSVSFQVLTFTASGSMLKGRHSSRVLTVCSRSLRPSQAVFHVQP